MNSAYIEELKEKYEDFAFSVGIANAKRLKAGFVSQDAYVKGIMTTITLHALDNLRIFTNEQHQNIIELCNTLRHG